jgi:LmbE family N-acetylglucosaminyl deacetylase
MSKKVLVIAAHPDDEILGCGGTVAKHTSEGDEVQTIIVCEGESLRYGKDVGQKQAIEKAANTLGVRKVHTLEFPDQKLDTYCLVEIISPIEKVIAEYSPQIIYCHYGNDVNRDHRIVFEAASVALRPVAESVEAFYSFYTMGSTDWGYPRDFSPDTWIDITQYLHLKVEAFKCYTSEIRNYPHPRSVKAIEHLAFSTGNQCCLEAAESFVTIRRIIRR